MRYRYRSTRRDSNQKEIIAAYESVGASVQDLSMIGGGCLDLLVGFRGVNYVVEVKNYERKGGRNNRVDTLGKQLEWRAEWNGSSCVVSSVDEALRAIGAIPTPFTFVIEAPLNPFPFCKECGTRHDPNGKHIWKIPALANSVPV